MMVSVHENILVWAFRYAIGRQTYAAEQVAEALIDNKESLPTHSRLQIVKEIKTEMEAWDRLKTKHNRAPWRRVIAAFEER